MDNGIKTLLGKRKNRAIAIILGYQDENVNSHLDEEVAEGLRKEILDQFNDYYHFCVDMLSSLDSGIITNDIYFERLEKQLEEIHGVIVNGSSGE